METTETRVVREFMTRVRSGVDPDAAHRLMADRVLAHQVQAEDELTVERTPSQYAAHVRDMLAAYGDFSLRVDELFGAGDRVYARWTQRGRHLGEVDGFPPTGLPVTQVTSAVYRVRDGRIVEYWIQIDRHGLGAQLRRS
ncbi:ester cyclase [Micromonospora purpureochromogenes]|uniref:Ester cyclase n=1 Tax=Micromonospora purpureochromogenes TaxID=47872 RepID=A0ABX2RIY5_9ACTN|nr:ester cyclase [Micromonospora purpureochromogenes]NYF56301.1 putative ester cyclase [Micromonospora purpureochromogenes]